MIRDRLFVSMVQTLPCSLSSLGVPQGSILGPLLFLIFINDLPQCILHSFPLLFADDTKCLCPISSPLDCQLLQSDLNNLSYWSSKWKLLFNEAKCSLLSFSQNNYSSANLFPYFINGCEILPCSHHKDLGIVTHCTNLCESLSFSRPNSQNVLSN